MDKKYTESQKAMIITMPDGSEWILAAEVVAHNRATHYAKTDPETTYEAEFDHAMNDSADLKDWAENDMNWDDVEDLAQPHRDAPEPDFQDGWVNGAKEIVPSVRSKDKLDLPDGIGIPPKVPA